MDRKHQSALNVMEGIEQPGRINEEMLKRFKAGKSKSHSTGELIEGILGGNRTLLSKAITLVESALPGHQEQAQEVIAACLKETRNQLPMTNDQPERSGARRSQLPTEAKRSSAEPITNSEVRNSSIRVGITGVPGVGKSTFIEALGTTLTARGHKLAVLAIDPSSSRSKGSILGDKTRMETLAVDPNAFIRPSPAAGSLGGVARKTRETILLCEAAGFDVIFIETVGVGQSETTVHSMVDFFLLLMLAGAGDELQGIKRGIIEMADAIVINKADGDNIQKAKVARVEYTNALHLFPPPDSGWIPVVDICSARSKLGIDHVWEIIMEHREATILSGYFQKRRMEQSQQVLIETIEEGLRSHFFSRKEISHLQEKLERDILTGHVNPYKAAQELLEHYFRKL
ncbi:MAG: methylmalonyl Co-A mutase-associated GTPase MeaB [Bacteroidota bacterium]